MLFGICQASIVQCDNNGGKKLLPFSVTEILSKCLDFNVRVTAFL